MKDWESVLGGSWELPVTFIWDSEQTQAGGSTNLAQLPNSCPGHALIFINANTGHGLYVDPNPDDNDEFDAKGQPRLCSDAGDPDVKTTVLHELGHALGMSVVLDLHVNCVCDCDDPGSACFVTSEECLAETGDWICPSVTAPIPIPIARMRTACSNPNGVSHLNETFPGHESELMKAQFESERAEISWRDVQILATAFGGACGYVNLLNECDPANPQNDCLLDDGCTEPICANSACRYDYATPSECFDIENPPGNVCTFDYCCAMLGELKNKPARYGDIVPNNFGFGPDGDVALKDILAVLDAFSGVFAKRYGLHNMDIAGSGGSCIPDAGIDLNDILAVLDAFSGIDDCGCGTPPVEPWCSGGAPAMMDPGSDGNSRTFTVRRSSTRKGGPDAMGGDLYEFDVFATDVVDLRAYQLGFDAEGELRIDTDRRDYVFRGLKTERRFDRPGMRTVNVVFDAEFGMRKGITRRGKLYLGTYRGPFENARLVSDRTQLLDSQGRETDIPVTREQG